MNRVYYLDFLRVFAILAIIATHISANFAKPNPDFFYCNFWYFAIILRWLGWIAVPIFLMISGALLFNRKESITEFLKKRYSRVLIPDLFWIAVFLIFIYYCSSINYLTFNEPFSLNLIVNTFFGKTLHSAYLWYIPVILVMYLLIAIINKIMMYYENILKYLLILSVIAVIIHQFIPFFESWHAWDINYIIFPIFGYYLFKTDMADFNIFKRFKITSDKIAIISLLIFFVVYIILIYNAIRFLTGSSLNYDHHFNIFNIIACISIFLFFKYFESSKGLLGNVFEFIKSNFLSVIISVSVCSYGMYLTHIIIKFIVWYYLPTSIFNGHFIICMVIWFTLVAIFSWLLTLILSKIPYLKEISGAG